MRKPLPLRCDGKIGVFCPSSPSHVKFRSRFREAISNIEKMGYTVILGDLTASYKDEGYRTATGRERAKELNELFRRDDVGLIMSTIGGSNSSSLLPYLDYRTIGASGKIFCGYSDVTSLHMAINTISGLSTLYGPAVIPSFGDIEGPAKETMDSFLNQVMLGWSGEFSPPDRWSINGSGWGDADHGRKPRIWASNPGLKCIQLGEARGSSLAANVNTLVCLAGSQYFPQTSGRILFLEEMNCPLSRYERNLMQLKLAGALKGINGIVLSKPELYDSEGAPFDDSSLLTEVLDDPGIPIISGFDNGHTHPMLSVPQGIDFQIHASETDCSIQQMESFTAQQGGQPDAFGVGYL